MKTETSWKNGQKVPYGTRGSTRIDVLDEAAGKAYDYKFTKNPPGLSNSQINKIKQHNPNVNTVDPVNP